MDYGENIMKRKSSKSWTNEDSECSGRLLSYGLGVKRENKKVTNENI